MVPEENVLGSPPQLETYWFCKACPLADECTTKNFKGWRPWGDTLEAAKERVMNHLLNSGLHVEASEGEDRSQTYHQLADQADYVEARTADTSRGTKRNHPSSKGAGASSCGAAKDEEADVPLACPQWVHY